MSLEDIEDKLKSTLCVTESSPLLASKGDKHIQTENSASRGAERLKPLVP